MKAYTKEELAKGGADLIMEAEQRGVNYEQLALFTVQVAYVIHLLTLTPQFVWDMLPEGSTPQEVVQGRYVALMIELGYLSLDDYQQLVQEANNGNSEFSSYLNIPDPSKYQA